MPSGCKAASLGPGGGQPGASLGPAGRSLPQGIWGSSACSPCALPWLALALTLALLPLLLSAAVLADRTPQERQPRLGPKQTLQVGIAQLAQLQSDRIQLAEPRVQAAPRQYPRTNGSLPLEASTEQPLLRRNLVSTKCRCNARGNLGQLAVAVGSARGQVGKSMPRAMRVGELR